MPKIVNYAKIARKVLEIVDAGLVRGIGKPVPGQMCVEAAVCYAMGLPHGDAPSCVSPALRSLKIRLNDAAWSSNAARAGGMRRLAIAQLGSAGVLDDKEFARRCAILAIQTCVPQALRAAAALVKSPHKERLLGKAALCEMNPTREHAIEARSVAADSTAYAAAYAAYAYAVRATGAAAYAAYAYTDSTAYAAYAYAARATGAADSAVYAATATATIDTSLGEFAEGVVQILIDMKAPGCDNLYMTEEDK